ncbi:MAG: hypothetical protein ACK559_01630 [bacterium]
MSISTSFTVECKTVTRASAGAACHHCGRLIRSTSSGSTLGPCCCNCTMRPCFCAIASARSGSFSLCRASTWRWSSATIGSWRWLTFCASQVAAWAAS